MLQPQTHTVGVVDFSQTHLDVDVSIITKLHSVEVVVLRDSMQEGKHILLDCKPGETRTVEFKNLRPGCIYTVRSQAKLLDGSKSPLKDIIAFTQAADTDLGDFGYSRPSQVPSNFKQSGSSGKPTKKTISKPKFENLAGVSEAEKLIGTHFTSDPQLIKLAGGKRELQKALLAGRKAPTLESYLQQTYKFARPPELQKERLQRALVYGNALIHLEREVVANQADQEEGYELFQNRWGMGPFYISDQSLNYMKNKRNPNT